MAASQERAQRIHFIGIGGSGLSAIARLLLESGYIVSGSDRTTISAGPGAGGYRGAHF